jgi:hypothetical protein
MSTNLSLIRNVIVAFLAAAGPATAARHHAVADAGLNLPHAEAPGAVPKSTPIPVCVPIGLAINKHDQLFVANHFASGTSCGAPGQITVYDSTGTPLIKRTITEDVQNPAGLAFDKAGRLYVADASQDKVFVYSAAGKLLTARTLTTDPNYNPSGVQVAPNGQVWVANRTGGNISIGEIQVFKGLDVIHTITENLVYPLGIAFQASNKHAWVGNGESPNDAITTYALTGKFLKQYPTSGFTPGYLAFQASGTLVVGNPLSNVVDFINTSGNVTASFSDGVYYPYGIAIDSKGNIYVANVGPGGDYNGSSVTKYTSTGTLLCTITTGKCE